MSRPPIPQALQTALQHHQAGQLAQAETLYRQVLAHNPNHADTLHLLGVLVFQNGQPKTAVELISRAIAIRPGVAGYYCNLGNALRSAGRLDQAIAAQQQALALQPDLAEAHNNLGLALMDAGQLDAAIAAYHRALQLKPHYFEAHNNLGKTLAAQSDPDAALACYRQAVALQPLFAQGHNNLGTALAGMGKYDDAIACYRTAIALLPQYPEAHFNLGAALHEKNDLIQCLSAYCLAIDLQPNYPAAHNNLGNALRDMGQIDQAAASYRQALTLQPDDAMTHNNLGNALKDMGQLDAAIASFRQALQLKPDSPATHSNLIYTMHFHPNYDDQTISQEQSHWNHRHALPLAVLLQPHANERTPERPLRIGYVSPDFYAQAESFFVVPLLEAHDRANFQVHCYASVRHPDATTARQRQAAHVWHDVRNFTDDQLAAQIRRDQIDILVDLTMHMAGNRLLVFARKPAPVQVTWLAYPGSTGLQTIDCRMTDSQLDPPAITNRYYSEQSIHLPDSWCCYDPLTDVPPASPRLDAWQGPVCFGSLNNPCKINESTLRLWAQVLHALPDSRLRMIANSTQQRHAIGTLFEQLGIAAARVEFAGHSPRPAYLRLYDQIDIALDPLPYNGITTTCDALWMGVPVVSLAGKTASGRAGQSILATIGLPELATRTPDDFVAVATQLAGDLPRLRNLRATLRPRMEASPLMDASRFARNMEAAYRQMWHNWCAHRTAAPTLR